MAKKKKPKKKKASLQNSLTTEQKELLDSIIADSGTLGKDDLNKKIPDTETALALLERLSVEDEKSIRLAAIIKDSFRDKSIQKKIKKIAYQLRQKGIEVPWTDERSDSPALVFINEKEAPGAWLGPIGLSGDRAILVMVPQAHHGVDLGVGVVNSFNGLIYFLFDRYSKKRSREVKGFFMEQTGDSIEMPIEHAAAILEDAYDKTDNKTEDNVRGYLEFRPWLKSEIVPADKPLVYDFIDREEAGWDKLTEASLSKLFEDEYMGSWIMESDDIEPVFEEITNVDNSPIILTEDQQKNRVNEIKEKAISTIFSDEKRLVLKSMLEEMAFFYHVLKNEELAMVCLAAAIEMPEGTSRFLTFLFDRSLEYYSTDDDREWDDEIVMPGRDSPTIITP